MIRRATHGFVSFQSILGRLYTQRGDGPIGEELIKLQQLVLPYHIAAVASSIRDGPLRELDYAFAKLGKADTKVLVVWVCRRRSYRSINMAEFDLSFRVRPTP